jgi:hypothetical protein
MRNEGSGRFRWDLLGLFRRKRENVLTTGPPASGRIAADAPREAALLFYQLQRDWRTPVRTFLRFRMMQPFGCLYPLQHRIAQSLQFRIFDSIEFDPKLEDGNRHQLRGVLVAVEDKGSLAFLEGCQNRPQFFV